VFKKEIYEQCKKPMVRVRLWVYVPMKNPTVTFALESDFATHNVIDYIICIFDLLQLIFYVGKNTGMDSRSIFKLSPMTVTFEKSAYCYGSCCIARSLAKIITR
jgi:hypothetical protein